MAKLQITGFEEAIDLLDHIANMPDEIIDEMLIAGGEVAAEALRYSTLKEGVFDTGQVYDSITLGKPRKDKTIGVYFKGLRAGASAPATKPRKSGAPKEVTTEAEAQAYIDNLKSQSVRVRSRNADVAFINEYGAPDKNIPARQFVRKAQEDAAEPATEAATRVFDEYMDKLK